MTLTQEFMILLSPSTKLILIHRLQNEILVQIQTNLMDTLKKIGKYKYAERHCLGEGSFGKVYEGTDESGRRVAIKKIEQRMIATDAYLKQSLTTEISIMKRLKHRNIVELVDTVATANSIYLILQFCKDGDLKRYAMNKRFTQDQALSILRQLIEGFYAMVKQGIIHRDLKPANVLVHDGVFKICDFGFAKYFGEMNRMAKTCVGTPIYMSPQVLKQKPYTSKSDVWSLGVMYYELLYGKIPFLGKSEDEIFKVITRGKLSIPKCSEESYLFLKNALVINEEERWDWNKVFQHFGVKENKQKPGFYQNFVNLFNGNNEPTLEKKVSNQNHQSSSFQFDKKLQKAVSFKDKPEIKYSNEIGSLEKQNGHQPKVKHNKMARNIFALDEQNKMPHRQPEGVQTPRNQQPNVFYQRIYNPEQTQKLRWLYNVTMKFLLKQPLYIMKIHSFQLFLFSLVTYTLGEYVKQTTGANLKQFGRVKKLILEQQKQTLEKLVFEIKRFEPCTDIRPISSIIQLQGKTILGLDQEKIVKELMEFYI